MTHARNGSHTDTPELPADFAEKSAYMRLYSSLKFQDTCWMKENFGDEIQLLLERDYAEVHANGYRMTEEGKRFWQAFAQRWRHHSYAPLHDMEEGEVAS